MGINTTSSNISPKEIIAAPSYNAVQINMEKPTVNATAPMIYNYPDSNGQIYYPPINLPTTNNGQENGIKRSPSEVDGYQNFSEINSQGQEVVSVKYSKDGDILVQDLKTTSPDGTTLEKTLKNSLGFKSSHIVIKDKDGNVLLTKDKSCKKLDDDKSQTIVNGQVYNISGLSGNIINIEHDGQVTELDLNKLLNPDVKLLKLNTSPDNFEIRDTKISDEEKEKLFNRIKSLSGDDLIRLYKSVNNLQFLDEKSIESFFVDTGKTLLLSGEEWENSHMVTEHELGHAINHVKVTDDNYNVLSDTEPFKTIRNYEKINFIQNSNDTLADKVFNTKFISGNPERDWGGGDPPNDDIGLRDETFAECYDNLNNMDIIHYEDEILPMRTLALFKYLPKTMIEVEKLSQI